MEQSALNNLASGSVYEGILNSYRRQRLQSTVNTHMGYLPTAQKGFLTWWISTDL